MEPAELSPEEVTLLLRDLCVELGFCLPPDDHDSLRDSPPNDVDDFAAAVFRVEGMEAAQHPHLYGQVRQKVAKAFGKPTNRATSS